MLTHSPYTPNMCKHIPLYPCDHTLASRSWNSMWNTYVFSLDSTLAVFTHEQFFKFREFFLWIYQPYFSVSFLQNKFKKIEIKWWKIFTEFFFARNQSHQNQSSRKSKFTRTYACILLVVKWRPSHWNYYFFFHLSSIQRDCKTIEN